MQKWFCWCWCSFSLAPMRNRDKGTLLDVSVDVKSANELSLSLEISSKFTNGLFQAWEALFCDQYYSHSHSQDFNSLLHKTILRLSSTFWPTRGPCRWWSKPHGTQDVCNWMCLCSTYSGYVRNWCCCRRSVPHLSYRSNPQRCSFMPCGLCAWAYSPLRDPCDSCTVTDSMADMMVATCPGRKKKRAILESALLSDRTDIFPSSASSISDIERWGGFFRLQCKICLKIN